MAKRGVDILLVVEDETTTGTFNVLGGQRGATLSEERETVDTTSKDSDGVSEFEYGNYTWSVSADGVHVASDEAYLYLKKAIREAKKIKIRFLEDNVAVEEGTVLLTSREFEAPYDGETTYSVEMQGTGAIAPVVVTP